MTTARPELDRGPGLAEVLGAPIGSLDRRTSIDRSTHALEEVEALLVDGRRLDLILKASGAAIGAPVRPRLVRDGRREAWAYRSVLDPMALDTPRYYGVLDADRPTERLVIEKVSGRPLFQIGDRSAWCTASRWLAEFHRWGRSGVPEPSRLLLQTRALQRRWWVRAARRATALRERDTAAWLREIESTYEHALDCLARSPRSLIHGEFYPSNIIVERAATGWRVHPIDWETIGVGSVFLDLAAFTTGDWHEEDRAELCRAYTDAEGDEPDARFRTDLAAGRLVNAMQWLGWSAAWRPPAHHARDWLAEARAAARCFLT